MTDHNRLKLAAKAAGIDACEYMGLMGRNTPHGWSLWNPRENAVDALHLAVVLCMKVTVGPVRSIAQTAIGPGYGECERKNGDGTAATREAIFRAAAQAGKNLSGE